LKEHFLVKEGYSLKDIEEMEPERYDYIIAYLIEMKMKGKDNNPFAGGL